MSSSNWFLTAVNEADVAVSGKSHHGSLGGGSKGNIGVSIYVTSPSELPSAHIVAAGIGKLNASNTLKTLL